MRFVLAPSGSPRTAGAGYDAQGIGRDRRLAGGSGSRRMATGEARDRSDQAHLPQLRRESRRAKFALNLDGGGGSNESTNQGLVVSPSRSPASASERSTAKPAAASFVR